MKDKELRNREVKIKREVEELFLKPFIVFMDDMDKFEKKETKKIRRIKNTWYDWLTNYIPEPPIIKPSSLFSTNTPKQTVYRRGKKLSKPKTQNKIKKK